MTLFRIYINDIQFFGIKTLLLNRPDMTLTKILLRVVFTKNPTPGRIYEILYRSYCHEQIEKKLRNAISTLVLI